MDCKCTYEDGRVTGLCAVHAEVVRRETAREIAFMENRVNNVRQQLADMTAERDRALMALGRQVLGKL